LTDGGGINLTDVGSITIGGKTIVGAVINSGLGDVTFNGGLECHGGFDNTGGDDIYGIGDFFISGTLTLDGASAVLIFGNVRIVGDLVNGSTGAFDVYGDLSVGGDINGTAAGAMAISGDCSVVNIDVAAGGSLAITGIATILGVINNLGTLTYRGRYPETPIDVMAIVGGVDILNLATANWHYEVDNLYLKCDDPGVDTVTIQLWRLVNGVLTQVGAFAITSAGTNPYTGYYSLNDMFGVDHLTGDQLQVVAVASANTYAVTGSYSHRSE
jgi:hypothetical protein